MSWEFPWSHGTRWQRGNSSLLESFFFFFKSNSFDFTTRFKKSESVSESLQFLIISKTGLMRGSCMWCSSQVIQLKICTGLCLLVNKGPSSLATSMVLLLHISTFFHALWPPRFSRFKTKLHTLVSQCSFIVHFQLQYLGNFGFSIRKGPEILNKNCFMVSYKSKHVLTIWPTRSHSLGFTQMSWKPMSVLKPAQLFS